MFDDTRHDRFIVQLESFAEGMRLLSSSNGDKRLYGCGDELDKLVREYKRDSAITLRAIHPVHPAWFMTALSFKGVKEIAGAKDHPDIVRFHGATAAGEAPDEVPWCSSFVCFCLEESGIRSTRSKAAKSWLNYGEDVTNDPRIGDIVVLERGVLNSKKLYHVTFFAGETKRTILGLGGNQKDSVCESEYPESKVVTIRRPKAA